MELGLSLGGLYKSLFKINQVKALPPLASRGFPR